MDDWVQTMGQDRPTQGTFLISFVVILVYVFPA